MATLTIILDKRSANRAGMHPIKFQLNHNGTNTTISTGCFTMPEYYTGNPTEVVTKKAYHASEVNTIVLNLYSKYITFINTLSVSNSIHSMSASDIRTAAEGRLTKTEKARQKTFTDVFKEYLSLCRAQKTKEAYIYSYDILCEHTRKETIEFGDITYRTLTALDKAMEKSGKKVNTRSIVFRNIRTLYNYAIKIGATDANSYPFRNFKIQKGRKEKEYLTLTQLRQLRDLPLQGREAKARDFFMLSFYLCGINPTDLYHLDHQTNTITFKRQKEKHTDPLPVHIGIQPEAQTIIDTYTSKKHLVSFADEYAKYPTFKANYGKSLRSVGKQLGIRLYFYMARYTWATYAAQLDIPLDVVSKALGHADKSIAEQFYITFDWGRVNSANRKVLDHIK